LNSASNPQLSSERYSPTGKGSAGAYEAYKAHHATMIRWPSARHQPKLQDYERFLFTRQLAPA